MGVDFEGLTASGLGEGFGDPVHLQGHFRVSLQDVTEPVVTEPDLASALIGEKPHVVSLHRLPFRKVYRYTA